MVVNDTMLWLVILFLFFGNVTIETRKTKSWPPELPRCHLNDPNFDECLRNAIEVSAKLCGPTGSPELGIPPLEPGTFDELFIPKGGGAIGFDQHYRDVHIHGISRSKVTKAHLDLENKRLTISTLGDLYQVAQYEFSGKILLIPISGKGNSTIFFYKADLTHTIQFKEEIRHQNTYFMVENYHIDINVTDHAEFYFENLFNGEKTLAEPVLKIMNENWKILVDEVKESIGYGYGLLGIKFSRAIFNHIPVYNIFLKD